MCKGDAIHNKARTVCLSATAVDVHGGSGGNREKEYKVMELKKKREVKNGEQWQWQQQHQRLVIDIRDLALPPDPASLQQH